MGWVWRDEENGKDGGLDNPAAGEVGEICSTRRTVTSRCRTEEVEPGKFRRKCERTEEILRDCVGRPVEVVESRSEYTEDDVTDLIAKGSFPEGKIEEDEPFTFPGLRSDIGNIERRFFGEIDRFFEAAEQMRNSFFNVFDNLHDRHPSLPAGVPRTEASPPTEKPRSGEIDISSLAKDV